MRCLSAAQIGEYSSYGLYWLSILLVLREEMYEPIFRLCLHAPKPSSDVGQDAQWRRHHKKICKQYNQYIASTSYQALPPNEKLDAQLLSHLVAELFCSSDPGSGPLELLIEGQPTPFSTFSSLIAGPVVNQSTPSVCPMGRKDTLMEGVLDELYSRFGNNNFAIHSHLVSVAHGIFPLASRLFNHSCVPNAVAKYIFEESEPVRMDVVALRDINDGEEVRRHCITRL